MVCCLVVSFTFSLATTNGTKVKKGLLVFN